MEGDGRGERGCIGLSGASTGFLGQPVPAPDGPRSSLEAALSALSALAHPCPSLGES